MNDPLSKLASRLQHDLAWVDLSTTPHPPRNPNYLGLLVAKLDRLKIKMYQEQGHSMPHLHIDYGKINHIASFAIEPAERIEGDLDKKYDRAITGWVDQNRAQLLSIWNALQSGQSPLGLIAELQGDK